MNGARRDLQERVLARLRAGDRLHERPIPRGGEKVVCWAFADGERVHRGSLASLARRGEVWIQDGEVRLP